jgi:hypothetical protein
MLRTRNYDRWLNKQVARHESMVGWNPQGGALHMNRREPTFSTKGVGFARKSFGRRPFSTFGKRALASKLHAKV